ncbi:hypothetical protein ONA70_36345, partial [Micromonospora yasonensis]|nr:hypothetical protein [Micromonospora yasonensis]
MGQLPLLGVDAALSVALAVVSVAALPVGAAELFDGLGPLLSAPDGDAAGDEFDGLGDGELLGDGEWDGLGLAVLGFGDGEVGFGDGEVGVGFGVFDGLGVGVGVAGAGTAPTTRVAA